MSSVKELFAVPPKQTKNFIAMNVRSIQKKSENVKCNKTSHSKVLKETNGQLIQEKTVRKPPTVSGTRFIDRYKPKAYRHAACQTLNLEIDESLLEDGVIRFPSSNWIQRAAREHHFKNRSMQTDPKNRESIQTSTNLIESNKCEDLGSCLSEDRIRSDPPEENATSDNLGEDRADAPETTVENNIIDINPQDLTSGDIVETKSIQNLDCKSKSSNKITNVNKTASQTLVKHKRGVVPRYIIEKKLQKEREQKKFLEEAERTGILDPDCPPGHILLPNEKRLEQLEYLNKNYKKLIGDLNRIPVRNDSLKLRQHRVVIEKELDKLETAIKLFSKEKIFVKP